MQIRVFENTTKKLFRASVENFSLNITEGALLWMCYMFLRLAPFKISREKIRSYCQIENLTKNLATAQEDIIFGN